jgi:hypothetical protein
MSLPNLDNYLSEEPTSSCYMDGRYFNLVFANYPGLIQNPLIIQINSDDQIGKVKLGAYMAQNEPNNNDINLIRVIIENITPDFTNVTPSKKMVGRHSNLLMVNNLKKRIYWFQPGDHIHQQKIQKILLKYLSKYYPQYLLVPMDPMSISDQTPGCQTSGFCVAYVIKYTYDILKGVEPRYENIRRFVSKIENTYGKLDPTNADVEYGLFGDDNKLGGTLLGGLGGAAIGTVVTGGSPTGAITGGLLGGTAGYLLS